MATVQHVDLVSSQVHEPKHITNSSSADAGKVITPLSGGSSELRYLTPAEVGVKFIYGEIGVDDNTTAMNLTAAGDSTLRTEGDYVQLNSTRIPTAYLDHAHQVTFNNTNKELIVPVAGDYRISFWCNVKSDVNNTKIGLKVRKNGGFSNFTIKADIAGAGRVESIHGSFITDMQSNSNTGLWIASDKTAEVVVEDLRFYVELLREV